MSKPALRRRRLLRQLAKQELPALLVCDPANVRYLTGFTGEDSFLLLANKHAVVVSDARYTTQLERECPDLQLHIRHSGTTMAEAVAQVARSLRLKLLAVEADWLSLRQFQALEKQLERMELVPTSGQVERLRAVKDADEVARIRQAVAVAQRAFQATVATLRADASERQVAAELEYTIRRLGGEGCSFPPIVAVGANAALPHAPVGKTRIGEANVLLIDWGASWQGYASDLTRTLATGRVLKRFAKAYQAVLEAQQAAIEAIAPGVSCGQVDQAARRVLEKHGLARHFTHSLGHGIGLKVHELPRLAAKQQEPLVAGMVVTVEPGVYLPGRFGIRIEDDVLVTPEGHEVLSTLPRDLEQLELPVVD